MSSQYQALHVSDGLYRRPGTSLIVLLMYSTFAIAGERVPIPTSDRCSTERLVTPSYDCKFFRGAEHGGYYFNCGTLGGSYSRRTPSDPKSYLDTVGSGASAKVPSALALKRKWNSPYPDPQIPEGKASQTFLHVGEKEPVDGTDGDATVQVIRYLSFPGERVSVVLGERTLANHKFMFAAWAKSLQDVSVMTRDMASMIADLRLESSTCDPQKSEKR